MVDFLVRPSKQGLKNYDAFRGKSFVHWHLKPGLSVKVKGKVVLAKDMKSYWGGGVETSIAVLILTLGV